MVKRLRQFVTSGAGAPPLHVSVITPAFIKLEGNPRDLALQGFDLKRLEISPLGRSIYDNAELILALKELIRLNVSFAENLKYPETAAAFMNVLQEKGRIEEPFLSLSWPGTGGWVVYRNFYNVKPEQVLGSAAS